MATEQTRIELADGCRVEKSSHAGMLRLVDAGNNWDNTLSIDLYNKMCDYFGTPDKKWPVEREWAMDVVSYSTYDTTKELTIKAAESGTLHLEALSKCDDYKIRTVSVTAPDSDTARTLAIAKVFGQQTERDGE